MPDGVIPPDPSQQVPSAPSYATYPASPPNGPRRRRPGLAEALITIGVLALFAVGGVVGGWVWHQLWNAPAGEAYQHRWVPLDETSLGGMFDATGLYLCVGVGGGLILGLLVAIVIRRAELVVFGAVVVGSALAAWLCHLMGLHLAPPDPAGPAASAADFTRIPGTMSTPGHSFYVAWPLGALLGLGFVYLITSGSTRRTAEPLPGWAPPPATAGPSSATLPGGTGQPVSGQEASGQE